MAKRLGLQLFVSRLSSYTTNHELERLFSPFGVVTEARLVVDPSTKKPKGYGFVTFESETEAKKAMKSMDGRIVNGRLIFVKLLRVQHLEKKKMLPLESNHLTRSRRRC